MKTLCSLLLLATLVALYTGHVDAQYSGGTAFKGYAVDCTVHTKACKKNRDPVCGMDGITHSNECVMCNKLGLSNTKLCAKRKGECDQKGKTLNCEGYPKAMCTMELRYHCGSDGRTYGNRCDYCNHQAEDSSLTCLSEIHCYDEKTPCK